MKKLQKVFGLLLVLMLSMLLQACSPQDFSISSLTTPVTSHSIAMDKYSKFKFELNLTADMTQNYDWYVYLPTGDLDETAKTFRKGMFNKTYYYNYAYLCRGEEDFTFYLILVKDGDLETCKAYPYNVHVSDTGISVSEDSAFTLKGQPVLYKDVTSSIDFVANY